MPVGHPPGEIERPVQRRRVVLGPNAGRLAVSGRAPRGIEPHRIDARQIGLFGEPLVHGDGIAERGEVVRGDRGGHLVGVDRRDADAESGESERVTADAAAEVGDRVDAGSPEAPGVPCRDREPGRLLEPGAGEQHAVGEVAELRARLHAQARLADDRRDELGGVTRRAQARHRARDIGGRFDRIESVEQPQPVGREQCGQLGHVHSVSLGAARPEPRPAGRRPPASPIDPL